MGLARSEKIVALENIPLFEGLSRRELASLADLMTERRVPDGTVLARQGALGSEAMIIMSGTAVVRRHGRIIDEMGAGGFFGEMSLINHEPRNATVTANSDVALLVMNSEQFSSLLESSPKVSITILRTVAARLAASQDRGTL